MASNVSKHCKLDLSILIPVYNYKINSLITELIMQCELSALKCEIQIIDDGSFQENKITNRPIQSSFIRYSEFNINQGRARVRNALSLTARGKWLLFLDNDVLLPDKLFIQRYEQIIRSEDKIVIQGGIIYPNNIDSKYSLHNIYGQSVVANQAGKKGIKSLLSCNLLIPRNIFLEYRYDHNLETYGHEDTLLGYQLKRDNIPLKYIPNPVIHADLDTNTQYLEKNKHALNNLVKLFCDENTRDAVKDNRIIKAYEILKKMHLNSWATSIYLIFKKTILNNLKSRKPSLFIFKVFKLGEFNYLMQKKY